MPFTFGIGSLLMLGLPLLAAPIIIHLINLMRHHRVEWAAMEFLLESQKRNSRWIILKQLLLLLLRVAALAAIVFMLAQTELRNELGEMLGSTRLHHIVLLDDTLSMNQQSTGESRFAKAKETVERLGREAEQQQISQTMTLLPLSSVALGQQPAFREVQVEQGFERRLEDVLRNVDGSELRVTPQAALESVQSLLGPAQGERRIYYFVSDFRTPDWDEPEDLAKQLSEVIEDRGQVRLVDCAGAAAENLAVVDLKPAGGTQAAGVPMEMEVTVRNFGTAPARDVSLHIKVDGRDDRLIVDRINAGDAETRKFEVLLMGAGQHAITASLEKPDSLTADNSRFFVADVAPGLPVLILDADPESRDGLFLSRALSPGGPVRTGLEPQVELPDYLDSNSLDKFSAVYLVNVDHLDPLWLKRLEEYVSGGGGLGIFLGKLSTLRFLTEGLYKSGEGLLPVPLAGANDLPANPLDSSPDMRVVEHPVFRIFAGERNSFLQTVDIKRYYEVERGWTPPDNSRMEIIAQLRNGSPLAVEQPFGEGRVIAFLTTASPDWNNWGRNPSFPVVMQELQSYLASTFVGGRARQIPQPLEVRLDVADYRETARFIRPGEDELSAVPVDLPQQENVLLAKLDDPTTSGIYSLNLTTKEGRSETRRYAFNVDTAESNLAKLDGQQLRERMPGVDFEYQPADRFSFGAELEGFNLSDLLLYLLIITLLAEQVLSYLVSYHPSTQGAAR